MMNNTINTNHKQTSSEEESQASMQPGSEPPQVTITPPKVVVVTTPSGTVFRTPTSNAGKAEGIETNIATTMTTTKPDKPDSNSSVTTTNSICGTPQALKLKVAVDPKTSPSMKVFPMGARILPKAATTRGGGATTTGTPVYMVATSVTPGSNVMRVSRSISSLAGTATGNGARVVTVSTASLRPQTPITIPGKPSVVAASAIR